MATLTFTQKENQGEPSSSAYSTWTFSFTTSDYTVSGPEIFAAMPSSVTCKYSAYGSKKYANMDMYILTAIEGVGRSGGSDYGTNGWISLAGNTNKAVSRRSSGDIVAETANVFNSSNPTTLKVPIKVDTFEVNVLSAINSSSLDSSYPWGKYTGVITGATGKTMAYIILNAPPTFTASQVSFDTDYGVYAGLTTASVNVSSLAAQYGGYITKAELEIGTQKAELTGSAANVLSEGNLSIPLAVDGTFIPKVTVTDSRGQKTVINLESITVLPYFITASNLQARRIDPASFKLDDEGTNAVLEVKFTHTHLAESYLLEPVVKVDDSVVNAAWYTSWTPSGAFVGAVSDWSSLSGEVILYAKITASLSKDDTHKISVIPGTNLKTGVEASTTLPQSFYLLAGCSGGHGLGIGMKPPSDAFHIDMDAYFYRNLFAQCMAGMVEMFAGSTAPAGWLLCDGAAVSRTTYANLFAVIGTAYGAGDGSTTFNLPDMRDRMAVGAGSSYALNAKGGSQYIQAHTHGFTQPKIPNHAHSIAAQATIQTYKATDSSGTGSKDLLWHSTQGTSVKLTLPAHNTNSSGGGGACTGGAVGAVSGATTGSAGNMPPYIGINFIICTGVTS